ncbi:MAG: hypothetical protein ACYC6L_10950, partial [Anaerolineae bacterium]
MQQDIRDRILERWHVPEPPEILAWLKSLPLRLLQYLNQPVHLVFWCIVALAALVRLAYLEVTPFSSDSAALLAASRTLLSG